MVDNPRFFTQLLALFSTSFSFCRIDSCSRNVYRYEDLKDSVSLDKVKDHFIFTVESVGGNRPEDLVSMAWDVMIEKCDHFIGELQSNQQKKSE